ncbi:MAG: CBS domain-containing protein, partial [Paracoccus sp. (in: a-proteobacteria)]|nr:CBS domain-containing protein [Paracoccus sp. (in: a-proteobacteria)]
APEACGKGIVPTTSTTMTLALGDALAVALMEHRRFTPEHFRTFHPGGKLGAQLSRVGDLMHDDMPLVSANTPMTEALLEISQKGYGVTGVTGPSGALVGIITDGDLRRHMSGLLDRRADEVMTAHPRTIHADQLAEAALAEMQSRKITCLFVVDDGLPRGILHIHDCLRAGLV